MISVDASLFLQIANFLLLVWAMNSLVYRPIRAILKERQTTVDTMTDTIDTCSRQVDEKNQAFQSGLRDARKAAMEKKAAIIQSAEEKEKEIVSRIQQDAQTELDRVRQQIRSNVEEVRASLQQKVDIFANDIGEKLLGRTIS